jgi:hypothetical protein
MSSQAGRRWPATLDDHIGEVVFVETRRGEKFCGRVDDYEFGTLLLWETTQFDPDRKEWTPIEEVGSETNMFELHYRQVRRLALRESGEPKLVYEWKRQKKGRNDFLATMGA